MDEGKWCDRQVISQDWVRQLVTPGKVWDGHGLLWWLDGRRPAQSKKSKRKKEPRPKKEILVYRGDGWLGQHVVVVPSKRIVAIRTRNPEITHWDERDEYLGFGWDVLRFAGVEVPEEQRQ